MAGRVCAPSGTSLTPAALKSTQTDFCPALLLASVLLTLATRPRGRRHRKRERRLSASREPNRGSAGGPGIDRVVSTNKAIWHLSRAPKATPGHQTPRGRSRGCPRSIRGSPVAPRRLALRFCVRLLAPKFFPTPRAKMSIASSARSVPVRALAVACTPQTRWPVLERRSECHCPVPLRPQPPTGGGMASPASPVKRWLSYFVEA